MISFSEYVGESVDNSWKEYIRTNKNELIKALNKYHNKITHITYRSDVTGKDEDGNSIKGVWLTFRNADGYFNQDTYVSNDGYIMDKVAPRQFKRNKYYKILNDLPFDK